MLTEKRRGVHPRLTLTPELRSDFLARVEASPELREKKEAFLAEQLDRAEELLGKEFVQFEGLINIYPACGQLGDISGVFGDLYLLGRCDERHLQKVKDELLSSGNNLRLANDKLDDLTIKKLTRNNPTMKQKFEEAGADVDGKKGK